VTQAARNEPKASEVHQVSRRWVLMGDPTHFSVKGGANPHTRTRWGTRRTVDKQRAIAQWHGLRAQLEELGIRVVVVPPVAEWPGTVYPANAGFMFDVDTPKPAAQKRFVLSNLLPSRAGEQEHYARALAGVGIPTEKLDPPLRFRMRPGALRVRIARQHPGASPSVGVPDGVWQGILELGGIAAGR